MSGWAALNTLRAGCYLEGDLPSLDQVNDALARVEAALEAADRVDGYGADLKPIWQLGAGQHWQEWSAEKNRFRAALRAVREGE